MNERIIPNTPANAALAVKDIMAGLGYTVNCVDGLCNAKLQLGVNKSYDINGDLVGDILGLDKETEKPYTGLGFEAQFKAIDREAGTVDVIASMGTPDRDGDVIEQEGISLVNFKKNPVILFAHDSRSLPIGKASNIKIIDGNLTMKITFALGIENFTLPKMILDLIEGGFLKGISIGFIPVEFSFIDENSFGRKFIRVELLEVSVVPVPAHQGALVQPKDIATLTTPAIEQEQKTETFKITESVWDKYVDWTTTVKTTTGIEKKLSTIEMLNRLTVSLEDENLTCDKTRASIGDALKAILKKIESPEEAKKDFVEPTRDVDDGLFNVHDESIELELLQDKKEDNSSCPMDGLFEEKNKVETDEVFADILNAM